MATQKQCLHRHMVVGAQRGEDVSEVQVQVRSQQAVSDALSI